MPRRHICFFLSAQSQSAREFRARAFRTLVSRFSSTRSKTPSNAIEFFNERGSSRVFPSNSANSEETRRLFYWRQFAHHPLRGYGRNQPDICDLLVPILKTERPGCPWYKAGWNVQSEIENCRSLLLIVDCNLVSVLILLFPSMPHEFKIVDHFQRMREPYFAHVQVCN